MLHVVSKVLYYFCLRLGGGTGPAVWSALSIFAGKWIEPAQKDNVLSPTSLHAGHLKAHQMRPQDASSWLEAGIHRYYVVFTTNKQSCYLLDLLVYYITATEKQS